MSWRADRGCVFLLTDYGSVDEFAGIVRAAVSRSAPDAPVVDLTHHIPPYDVRAGALALARCVPHLGPGVVVAVVDPGVGAARRAVAVATGAATGPGVLIGPDNGLLAWALDLLGGPTEAVSLRPTQPPSTFDGRDVFAPAAARLWRGESLADLGTSIDPMDLVRLRDIGLTVSAGRVEAEVLWIDHFGNIQLAAGEADAVSACFGPIVHVVGGGRVVPARRVGSFAQLEADEVGLVVDANGHLAVVCDRRSAASALGIAAGDVLELRAISEPV
jgi:S-adenosylmethionine hydrolase